MEKPAMMALAAVFLYALQNVLLEQKFRGVNTLSLMMVMYGVVWVLSLITGSLRTPTGFPLGDAWPTAILAGTILFVGNYLMTGSYTNGGTVFTITMITVSMPVIASAVRYLWVGGLPTGQQMVGYLLAIASVYLIITGRAKPA